MSLQSNFTDSLKEHQELARNDLDYFKKNHKYARDYQFILNFVEDKDTLARIPKNTLNLVKNKELIIDLAYKNIELIDSLSVNLKDIYNKYKEDFLIKCYQSSNK